MLRLAASAPGEVSQRVIVPEASRPEGDSDFNQLRLGEARILCFTNALLFATFLQMALALRTLFGYRASYCKTFLFRGKTYLSATCPAILVSFLLVMSS